RPRHHEGARRPRAPRPPQRRDPGRRGDGIGRQDHDQGHDGRAARRTRAGAEDRGQPQQPVRPAAHAAAARAAPHGSRARARHVGRWRDPRAHDARRARRRDDHAHRAGPPRVLRFARRDRRRQGRDPGGPAPRWHRRAERRRSAAAPRRRALRGPHAVVRARPPLRRLGRALARHGVRDALRPADRGPLARRRAAPRRAALRGELPGRRGGGARARRVARGDRRGRAAVEAGPPPRRAAAARAERDRARRLLQLLARGARGRGGRARSRPGPAAGRRRRRHARARPDGQSAPPRGRPRARRPRGRARRHRPARPRDRRGRAGGRFRRQGARALRRGRAGEGRGREPRGSRRRRAGEGVARRAPRAGGRRARGALRKGGGRAGGGGASLMLYWALYSMRSELSVLNVTRYITFRTAVAALTALFLVLVLGPWVIERLRRLSIGQYIREEGPQAHKSKAGTPTMGGVLILVGILVPTLLWADLTNRSIWILVLSTLAYGLVGFADDYIKVVQKRSLGLTAR